MIKMSHMKNISLIFMFAGAHYPAAAASFTADMNNFNAVMSAVSAGDKVILNGTFENTLYIKNKSYDNPVKIDASNAQINRGMQLTSVNGLNIVGGQWRHIPEQIQTITITRGSNISLSNAHFSNDVAGTTGRAIYANLSSRLTIRDNSFDKIYTAMVIGSTTDSLITRNRVTNASSDGISIANSHRITVSNNTCTGTSISPHAHPDCIQLWSFVDQPVQSNIAIINNVAEGATQGFTSFDPGSFSGRNIVFAGNLGKISYPQGIACYGCQDSLFLDNTLVTLPGSRYLSIIRTPGGLNNTFINNQIFDFRSGTLADVEAVVHSFSSYVPDFKAGSEFDYALLSEPVPDAALWMQLIAGFGLTGIIARRRRRTASMQVPALGNGIFRAIGA